MVITAISLKLRIGCGYAWLPTKEIKKYKYTNAQKGGGAINYKSIYMEWNYNIYVLMQIMNEMQ